MFNIIVGGQIHHSGIELLKSIDNFNVNVLPDASQQTLDKNIQNADAILLRLQSFSKSLIDQCPKLKILSRNGVGYDRIDIPELTKRKIPLTIVGDVNSSSVAEHTIMLILDLLKSTKKHDQMVRSENWKDRDLLISNDFEDKRILIIGFGRIGQKVAKIADAFGAKILIFDPYINTANSFPINYQIIGKLDLGLKQADIITLHAPGTTEPIINEREISLTKKNAIIINTSRGSHIDLNALCRAIEKKHIKAAGLDVYPVEPPNIKEEGIFKLENSLFTPHIAGLSNDCASRMALNSAQNIIDALNGSLKSEYVINKEVL
jgi:D-3-phosphoglycerate dehydrogenase